MGAILWATGLFVVMVFILYFFLPIIKGQHTPTKNEDTSKEQKFKIEKEQRTNGKQQEYVEHLLMEIKDLQMQIKVLETENKRRESHDATREWEEEHRTDDFVERAAKLNLRKEKDKY